MPISLSAWESFYVITGSSGAALTGLMFVVVALAAERLERTETHGLSAFSTPTIMHFGVVLLIASIMTMPLHGALSLGICLGACAAGGLMMSVRAGVRMGKMTTYDPVWEDWAFNVIVPFATYLALLLSAVMVGRTLEPALFAIAGTSRFSWSHRDTTLKTRRASRRDWMSN
jgi:hypothetical protein